MQITNVVLMVLEQVPDSGDTTNVSLRGRGGRGRGRAGTVLKLLVSKLILIFLVLASILFERSVFDATLRISSYLFLHITCDEHSIYTYIIINSKLFIMESSYTFRYFCSFFGKMSVKECSKFVTSTSV